MTVHPGSSSVKFTREVENFDINSDIENSDINFDTLTADLDLCLNFSGSLGVSFWVSFGVRSHPVTPTLFLTISGHPHTQKVPYSNYISAEVTVFS